MSESDHVSTASRCQRQRVIVHNGGVRDGDSEKSVEVDRRNHLRGLAWQTQGAVKLDKVAVVRGGSERGQSPEPCRRLEPQSVNVLLEESPGRVGPGLGWTGMVERGLGVRCVSVGTLQPISAFADPTHTHVGMVVDLESE